MTGEKNRRSLFALSNAAFVESLGANSGKVFELLGFNPHWLKKMRLKPIKSKSVGGQELADQNRHVDSNQATWQLSRETQRWNRCCSVLGLFFDRNTLIWAIFDPCKTTKRNLNQLEGLRLEHFSTARYTQLNQHLIMTTLNRENNQFRSLDLS